jgi:serine phosphatase RsbU (regulator of sigma subunit)
MLPRGWGRRTIVLLTFALLFGIDRSLAHAQVFDLGRDRVQMAELHGFWRFQIGDDPDGKLGWAKPDFDDSSWKLLHSDRSWRDQGFADLSGVIWYRFRVNLPANHPPLALFVPDLGTSYQVFADGELVGQFGGLPPHEKAFYSGQSPSGPALEQVMPIRARVADGKQFVVIAIRAWQWPGWSSVYDPEFQHFRIGEVSLMNEERQLRRDHRFWSLSAGNFLFFCYLLAAVAGLALFLLRPGEREYLWFALTYLTSAAGSINNVYPVFHPVWEPGYLAGSGLIAISAGICSPMFYMTFLKQPRGWAFWSSIGTAIFGSLMFIPVLMGWMSLQAWIPVIFLVWSLSLACQFPIIYTPARRGSLDARLLLGPFCLEFGTFVGGGLLVGLGLSGHAGSLPEFLAAKWLQLFHWPFPISIPDLADFLAQISILAILVLRFARTRRDEERFKAELEAARTVQQVLIPEEIPAIPGLALECIYRPAGQVGGDFFQILPITNNGALIVIGDVSGKGMPAAMAVSLLVGTVRTLAHYTQSPAEILTAMNQRMLARSKDGFTTCLVLRIDANGAATLANAGHLAPYLGAQELVIESGLPLGLAAESVYTESSFYLDMGQELTLLTDGVAEARAKTGELFGFDRTASVSILSAEHIAATAQAFGQQDDITVLKIRRCPVPHIAEVPVPAPLTGLAIATPE